MGWPAAKVADMQVCPMFAGPVRHVEANFKERSNE